jgi:AAHS family 4-hydroxybenzoate transporter-like MFS transporter
MFIGFSLGSAIGGLIAAQFISKYGWTSVFWLGGLVPIALAPVLYFILPESIRLLALRGSEDNRIRALMARINPDLRLGEAHFVISEEHPRGFTVMHLFTEGRARATILFWIIFFMNLLDLYFLANWLPTVINNAGLSVELAVITTSLLQVGGAVGVLVMARLMDRGNPYLVLGCAFFFAAILIASIGSAGSTVTLLIPAVFATGFCVVGAQIGSNALAATFYPTFIRSTGVGWALGIGRIGSIVGPVLGGLMLSAEWHTPTIFLIGAIPVLIASCAVIVMSQLPSSKRHLEERAIGAAAAGH